MLYPEPLARLISEFQKMPTIGPKSAERLSFHVLTLSLHEVQALNTAILEAKTLIRHCSICYHFTDTDPCYMCQDPSRDHTSICVVSTPRELLAMEKSREFKGMYHVLGGVIAPLDNVSPDKLRIKELLSRVQDGNVKEVILAINPTVEGEATIIYLSRLLKPLGVKTTRIAYGLPVGGDIDYADELTLAKSLEGRQEIG